MVPLLAAVQRQAHPVDMNMNFFTYGIMQLSVYWSDVGIYTDAFDCINYIFDISYSGISHNFIGQLYHALCCNLKIVNMWVNYTLFFSTMFVLM